MIWMLPAWRTLRKSPLRTILLAVTIMVSIASYYGTTSFITQFNDSIAKSSRQMLGGDLMLTSYLEPYSMDDSQALPESLSETFSFSMQTRVASDQRVSNIVLKGISESYPFYGRDRIHPKGEWPANGVYLTKTAAERLQAKEGDTIKIPDRLDQMQHYTVTAIINDTVEFYGDAAIFGSMYIHYDQLMKNILDLDTPVYNERLIKLREGASISDIQADLQKTQPQTTIITPQIVEENQFSEKKFVLFYLQFVSLISLFIATIAVYNTMKMVWMARLDEIAVYKAVGMKGWKITRILLSESLILGTIGSISGGILGILFYSVLSLILGHAIDIEMTWRMQWWTLLVACGLGILVTLCATLLSVRPLLRINPTILLRISAQKPLRSRSSLFEKLIVFLGAAAISAFYIRDVLAPGVYSLSSYVTCFFISIGILLVAIIITQLGSSLFRLFFYLIGKIKVVRSQSIFLSLQRVGRHSKKNGLIAFVLSVSICSVLASLVFGQNLIHSVNNQVMEQLEGNVIVTSSTGDRGQTENVIAKATGTAPPKPHMQAQLDLVSFNDQAFQEKIFSLQKNKRVAAMFRSSTVTVESVDLNSSSEHRYKVIAGTDLTGNEDEALFIEEFHTDLGLQVGDTVTVKINDVDYTLKAKGFFQSGTVKTAFLRVSDAEIREWNIPTRFIYYTSANDQALEQMYSKLPPSAMTYSMNQAAVDGLQNILDMQKKIFTLISAFTLLIAALLIANQFMNTILEAQYDLAILKTCGVGDRQIKRSFLIENGLISIIGGAAGTFVSLFVAAVGELLVSGMTDVPVRLVWFVIGCGIALFLSYTVTSIVSSRLTRISPARLLHQG